MTGARLLCCFNGGGNNEATGRCGGDAAFCTSTESNEVNGSRGKPAREEGKRSGLERNEMVVCGENERKGKARRCEAGRRNASWMN